MLTRCVMKKYVDATWSSNQDRERYYLKNQFRQEKTQIIQYNETNIGRITTSHLADRTIIEGIHIIEDFQGKGIGTHLIAQCIKNADNKGVVVELILLKNNPAKQLYLRMGFHQYKEDQHRYYMRTVPHP